MASCMEMAVPEGNKYKANLLRFAQKTKSRFEEADRKSEDFNVETTAQKTSNWVIEYGGNEEW